MDYCLGVEIGNDTTSWARTERTHDTITVTATGEFASVVGLDSSGALAAAGADIELAHLTTDFVDSLGQSEPVIVGQTPYGVEALIACLISAAVATNEAATGAPPDAVGLVHPDGMDEFRLSLLSEAARIAGLPAEHTIVMSRSDARAHTPDGPAGAGAATAAWAGIPVTPIAGAAGTAAAAAGAATAAGLTAAAVHLSADSTASAAGATAGPAGTSIAGTPTGPAGTSIGTTTGPAGTPIGSAGTTTGPAGTPIGATGATGTPITPAGPTGAPITPTAGPAGTPLDMATAATRVRPRWFPAAVAAGAVAVVAVVAVVVVASGSDDPPPEAAPASSTIIENRSAGNPGTPGATTPAATTPAATTPAATTPDTVAAVELVSGSDECLVGDWAISAEQMNRFYAEVLAGVDSPFRMVASGSISLSFGADGTFIWAPALTLAMDVEEIAMTGASSGEVTGRWTTTGDTLTFVDTANNITTTFSVEGVAVDSGAFGTQLTTSPPADVPYSCAGATPVIDFPAGTGADVPMTLAPA